MADEFVDFYEVLELPLDADRTTIRKRINELYIEAQRNLDHRNFATRVKFQELFEVTLPQARYILLDEGRRNDYDRMVRDARAPAGTAVAPPPATKKPSAASTEMGSLGQGTAGFKLSETESALQTEPQIDALPPDPEKIAREREETWNKWKAGLQSAMEREAAREKAAESAAASPRAQTQPAPPPVTPASASRSAPPERPKVKFDFGERSEPEQPAPRDEQAPVAAPQEFAEGAKQRLSPQEIERRRNEHRHGLMKSELTDVSLKGMLIGAAAVWVPGVIAMVIFMSRFYPRGEAPQIALSSGLAWTLWLVFLVGASLVASRLTSKSMRRKSAMDMSLMSYEELLKYLRKDH